MFCFMGSLSAEKQIEKTSEQGSLLGSAHCVCSTDSLRDIPTDTDFGSTVRTDMPGVSPSCMGTTVGNWRLKPKAQINW